MGQFYCRIFVILQYPLIMFDKLFYLVFNLFYYFLEKKISLVKKFI